MGEDDNGGVVMGDEDDKEYILQHFPPWGQWRCYGRGMMHLFLGDQVKTNKD
jgi:hypothetical protein